MSDQTGTARVIRGNALDLAAAGIADNSVDLIVTSPPYFGLRSYQDGGEHYAGQVGDEATPREFVDALVAATAEMRRVIKPGGSIFVNLGDKYAGAGRGNNKSAALNNTDEMMTARLAGSNRKQHLGLDAAPAKSLIGIPWRYALRCIDDLGLILRAEVIWQKANGLPESVVDRVRRSHEQWFHFTKEPRYYTAIDEIREATGSYASRGSGPPGGNRERHNIGTTEYVGEFTPNPLGKLPGSVWTIPTQPLRAPKVVGLLGGQVVEAFYGRTHDEAWPAAWKWQREGTRSARRSVRPLTSHFAAFPVEWPRRIIRAFSPPGICTACGEGRRPVIETHPGAVSHVPTAYSEHGGVNGSARHGKGATTLGMRGPSAAITGYVCACPEPTAPTTPAVVLDPFGGTGTTALVAAAWGREGVTVDLSRDYCRLARWRTSDPKQMAMARKVPPPKRKPPVADVAADVVDDDLLSMLALMEGDE